MTPLNLKLPKPKFATPAAARPYTAVELTPEGALAATLPSAGAAPVYAFAPLPAGALVPGIAEANIKAPDAVAEALRAALDQIEPKKHSVSLILPDTTARVFVLDFDSLPAKLEEAIPVLRFRLRKMVPFDVEHAAVSYQILAPERCLGRRGLAQGAGHRHARRHARRVRGRCPRRWLRARRRAALQPGRPCWNRFPRSHPRRQPVQRRPHHLHHLGQTISCSTAPSSCLPIMRARLDEVQRSIAVAAAWFEDKLQAPARRLHYAGAVPGL